MTWLVLAALYEVWKWNDGDATFVGIVLATFGVFGTGFIAGRGDRSSVPPWTIVAVVSLFVGVGILMAVYGGGCEPGECERPGP